MPVAKPKIAKVCEYCGKDFAVSPYLQETARFCSRKCHKSKPKVEKVCEYCGKSFTVTPYRKETARFCSIKCKNTEYAQRQPRGELDSQYKHGFSGYRQFIKENCEECGATDSLIVHHKDENRYNNALDNLETLCRMCHAREHNVVAHTKHNWGDRPRLRRVVL